MTKSDSIPDENRESEKDSEVIHPQVPLTGWKGPRVKTPFVEILDDGQLRELNAILRWNSFSADSQGRRFGDVSTPGKRNRPQVIPDKRVLILDDTLPLARRSVLELGCFEGHHTIGLCQRAKSVTAIDSRVENVVKTIVRTAFFDLHPRVFVSNIEAPNPSVMTLLESDVCFHVGVLYHLKDPVTHLRNLGSYIRDGVLLDTHYATKDMANESYEVSGNVLSVHRQQEHGVEDVFSGMYDFSRWLLLDDILECLEQSGFRQIQRVEPREERNGPRVLILACRSTLVR